LQIYGLFPEYGYFDSTDKEKKRINKQRPFMKFRALCNVYNEYFVVEKILVLGLSPEPYRIP